MEDKGWLWELQDCQCFCDVKQYLLSIGCYRTISPLNSQYLWVVGRRPAQGEVSQYSSMETSLTSRQRAAWTWYLLGVEMSHTPNSQFMDHCRRRDRHKRQRQWVTTRKHYFPDIAGQLYFWMHSGYDNMKKDLYNLKRNQIPTWRGRWTWSPCPRSFWQLITSDRGKVSFL